MTDNPMPEVRFLDDSEYPLLSDLLLAQGVRALPDPAWSKIIGAFAPDGSLVGCMCLQLVAHVEPVVVSETYRGLKLASEMAEMMDAYASTIQLEGAYCQPTNPASQHLAESNGYTRCEHPLYVKHYLPKEIE